MTTPPPANDDAAFNRHFSRILLVTVAASVLGAGGIRVGTGPLTDETARSAQETALLREETTKLREEYAALRREVKDGFGELDRRVGSLEEFRETMTVRKTGSQTARGER